MDMGGMLTFANQPRNVPVGCDFSGWDLLHGHVDGGIPALGFIGALAGHSGGGVISWL